MTEEPETVLTMEWRPGSINEMFLFAFRTRAYRNDDQAAGKPLKFPGATSFNLDKFK